MDKMKIYLFGVNFLVFNKFTIALVICDYILKVININKNMQEVMFGIK
jgi:hypothetical protein